MTWRRIALLGFVLAMLGHPGRAEEAETPAEPSSGGRVSLPETEIQGEIEKPDVFFVLPRALDRTDDQVIRSRLRREITRPLVKDWLEESLLLE